MPFLSIEFALFFLLFLPLYWLCRPSPRLQNLLLLAAGLGWLVYIAPLAALALAAVLLLLLAESKIPLLMSLGFGGAMIALLALMLYDNRRIRALAIRDDCSVLTGFGRRFLDTLENRG